METLVLVKGRYLSLKEAFMSFTEGVGLGIWPFECNSVSWKSRGIFSISFS